MIRFFINLQLTFLFVAMNWFKNTLLQLSQKDAGDVIDVNGEVIMTNSTTSSTTPASTTTTTTTINSSNVSKPTGLSTTTSSGNLSRPSMATNSSLSRPNDSQPKSGNKGGSSSSAAIAISSTTPALLTSSSVGSALSVPRAPALSNSSRSGSLKSLPSNSNSRAALERRPAVVRNLNQNATFELSAGEQGSLASLGINDDLVEFVHELSTLRRNSPSIWRLLKFVTVFFSFFHDRLALACAFCGSVV